MFAVSFFVDREESCINLVTHGTTAKRFENGEG